ncbi:MAG: flagellar basal body protein, partial [bacterium]|nr:flagellar basal body protein [bacterium]
MQPVKLVDTTLLEKALDAASLRQQVISNNMANINTPG